MARLKDLGQGDHSDVCTVVRHQYKQVGKDQRVLPQRIKPAK